MKKTQVFVALAVGLPLVFGAGVFRNRHVGDVTPAGTFVPVGRYVKPDGVTDTLSAAVVDICLVRNRSLGIVKTSQSLVLVDLATGTTLSRAPVSGGSSMVGVALSPDGGTVAASNSTSQVALFCRWVARQSAAYPAFHCSARSARQRSSLSVRALLDRRPSACRCGKPGQFRDDPRHSRWWREANSHRSRSLRMPVGGQREAVGGLLVGRCRAQIAQRAILGNAGGSGPKRNRSWWFTLPNQP